jgi:3',5'-cyclic-AMP phosphodiesterase
MKRINEHPAPTSTAPTPDGIDRRDFLSCMAWAGTGLLWSIAGGIPTSRLLAESPQKSLSESFSFVQISDSHIGFSKPANPDVSATLEKAIARINAGPTPDFLIHTGDITQNSKPAEFDTAAQLLTSVKTAQTFYVPGEHDYALDDGALYLQRFAPTTKGTGYYSYTHKGVHFIALNNVALADALGTLGPAQLTWLKADLAPLTPSTPIVVFAHIPLWTIYEKWGWGTADGAQALALLARFGSVTILNGHIHQTVQKIEGNVSFHTAMSTAFPQPAPGTAPGPGPVTVPAGQLASVLGVTTVRVLRTPTHLAITDQTLA